jgi:hypothetical protein
MPSLQHIDGNLGISARQKWYDTCTNGLPKSDSVVVVYTIRRIIETHSQTHVLCPDQM